MPDTFDTDVLVIGAGPTGLTLACDLSRRLVTSRIIERDAEPSRASKAKRIQSRSLEVLDDLGAVGHVLARGVAELPMRFHEPSGAVDKPSIGARADDAFRTPYPDALWIGQFDVETALRQRLAELGGKVEFGTEAIGIEQDDDGVTVTVRTRDDEKTLRARYVVGADGGKSSTRKLSGIPLVGKTHDEQRWYLGDVTVAGLDRDHMHIWPSERGMLGLTPLPGTELWQFQSPILPADEPGVPSLEFYQRLFDERAGSVQLTSATWLSVYQVNVRMVEDYRKGRVLLAGDAAHVHSPAGGQGMNTGIQDAYNLGWKITSAVDGARSALLDTYAAERMPVARAVLASSTDKMTRTMAQASRGSEDGLGSALADMVDSATTTGLGIHYRTSPMMYCDGEETDTGPKAGDRAPNVHGLNGGDLFSLLRGPRWSLITWNHDEPVLLGNAKPTHLQVLRIGSAPDSSIVDTSGEFPDVYRPRPGELIMIRPDGHLVARVAAEHESDLIAHLAPFRSSGTRVRPA
ncbi:FAD-dependent monooxygenase [Amycolatopsis jejuensis]|uniref:FAD-dependent monooxygenase n=1 Tax=Amycolatopsis jejuensis TaxID=330084 RepID=UPI000527BFCA|nr:FAD-dependent monooxygenase [Amycolatopsis jejuensis]